jgi:superfamily II DNA/RNA helicase
MAAETGSGKTLAYGASILSKLIFLREKQPKAKGSSP